MVQVPRAFLEGSKLLNGDEIYGPTQTVTTINLDGTTNSVKFREGLAYVDPNDAAIRFLGNPLFECGGLMIFRESNYSNRGWVRVAPRLPNGTLLDITQLEGPGEEFSILL